MSSHNVGIQYLIQLTRFSYGVIVTVSSLYSFLVVAPIKNIKSFPAKSTAQKRGEGLDGPHTHYTIVVEQEYVGTLI